MTATGQRRHTRAPTPSSQILRSMSIPFEGVNILADDRLRSGMKEYSQWPTFPQVSAAADRGGLAAAGVAEAGGGGASSRAY